MNKKIFSYSVIIKSNKAISVITNCNFKDFPVLTSPSRVNTSDARGFIIREVGNCFPSF